MHASTEEEATRMIKNSVRCVLITSSSIGSTFVPSLFCGIKTLDNLMSCIIYCEESKISAKWANEYPIVKEVVDDSDALVDATIHLSN